MVSRKSFRKHPRWREGEAGSAAIEFGLLAPFLVLLAVGTAEIGSSVYEAMQAQNAAEAGAVYASKYGFDTAGIVNSVENATGGASITAVPAPATFCGCPTASGVTAMSCAATCAEGSAPGQYLRISAQITHNPSTSLPGLVMPGTITGQAIVRMY